MDCKDIITYRRRNKLICTQINLLRLRYVLDSCILTEHQKPEQATCGHAIAGITCDKNQYIFNGWRLGRKTSCPLQRFDWKTSDQNFSLSNTVCPVQKPIKNRLTFNFQKGTRVCIYVRSTPVFKPSEILAINNNMCGVLQPEHDKVCDPRNKKYVFKNSVNGAHILNCIQELTYP